jgi:hypothetical protein
MENIPDPDRKDSKLGTAVFVIGVVLMTLFASGWIAKLFWIP